MVQVNSPGRVPHKIKSIDVETNLLAERIGERERLLEALSKRALAGFLVLGFAIVSLPIAFRFQAKTAERLVLAKADASRFQSVLTDKKAILTTAQPVVQETAMLGTARLYASNLLTQIGGFLNCASDKMVFSAIKIDVLGGDAKFSARADAETYGAARDFVEKLAKLPGAKQVTLKKWRQNPEFSATGVTFEIEHAAGVGK